MNGDLENHLEDQQFRFFFKDLISSLFCHSPIKTPPTWQETSAKNLPRFCDYAEGIWKGDILVSDTEERENLNASKSVLEDKGGPIPDRKWNS